MENRKLELVPCNLCGADNFKILYNRPFKVREQDLSDYMASTDHFDNYGQIVRCNICHLVYTNPRPIAENILKSYERVVDDNYREQNATRSINAYFSLTTITRFALQHGKLLEVGCGPGYFLNAARIDFEVTGVEPNLCAAEYAKKHLKLDVRPTTLPQVGFDAERFDVAVMIDTIEHLTDCQSTLREIHRILKKNGILYIVTPNIRSLSARVLRGYWWGLRPAHLYYFSKESLIRILQKTGFQCVYAGSYGRIFDYGYWLSRLQSYPQWIYKSASLLVQAFQLEKKFLYLNTRDSLELCARKV